MKDLSGTDSDLFPKKYMDIPVTHIRFTIDMEMKKSDHADLEYCLVEAYRKFSEITKGNITCAKVTEL